MIVYNWSLQPCQTPLLVIKHLHYLASSDLPKLTFSYPTRFSLPGMLSSPCLLTSHGDLISVVFCFVFNATVLTYNTFHIPIYLPNPTCPQYPAQDTVLLGNLL